MNTNQQDFCTDFPRTVWQMLGGELPNQKQWEDHASACSDCQRVLSEARIVLEAYRGLPEENAPDALIQVVVARAVVPEAVDSRWTFPRFVLRVPRLWRPGFVAVAACVLFLVSSNLKSLPVRISEASERSRSSRVAGIFERQMETLRNQLGVEGLSTLIRSPEIYLEHKRRPVVFSPPVKAFLKAFGIGSLQERIEVRKKIAVSSVL